MQRLRSFILNYELDVKVNNFETDYFQLWFLIKSNLRCFTAGKFKEIFRIKYFLTMIQEK